MITRRDLICALGVGSLAAPFTAFAQQPGKVWRVGYLAQTVRPRDVAAANAAGGFVRGLRELGYVEGRNLVIEWRFADNNVERLPGLAAKLMQLKVDVLLTPSPEATRAAQQATKTIPIVMGSVGDPVGFGFVSSLGRPGGNITGVATLTIDLGPKRLEMLLAMAPRVSRVAVLLNPAASTGQQALQSIQAAATQRRITILPVYVGTNLEIETGFAAMARQKAGALIVPANPLFNSQRNQIGELTLKHRLPAITADRMFVETGSLMSYGTSLAEDLHRAATYVDKIFKGAKPADLPVEQPTRLALVINGKTAKSIGIVIPKELLLQAETVME